MSLPDPTALLERSQSLAARRPVAARVIALAGDPEAGGRDVARALVADVALAAAVMRRANGAAYGVSGRVRSLPLAVTVVGLSGVRALAALAVAGADADDAVPDDFWPRSKVAATASAVLAEAFSLPPFEAYCLTLLSGLGEAVMYQHDPGGYRDLVATVGDADRAARSHAEEQRYGVTSGEVSARSLASWGFAPDLVEALRAWGREDEAPATSMPMDAAQRWVRCLRTAVEVAHRVVDPTPQTLEPVSLTELSGGVVSECDSDEVVLRVKEAIVRDEW